MFGPFPFNITATEIECGECLRWKNEYVSERDEERKKVYHIIS